MQKLNAHAQTQLTPTDDKEPGGTGVVSQLTWSFYSRRRIRVKEPNKRDACFDTKPIRLYSLEPISQLHSQRSHSLGSPIPLPFCYLPYQSSRIRLEVTTGGEPLIVVHTILGFQEPSVCRKRHDGFRSTASDSPMMGGNDRDESFLQTSFASKATRQACLPKAVRARRLTSETLFPAAPVVGQSRPSCLDSFFPM